MLFGTMFEMGNSAERRENHDRKVAMINSLICSEADDSTGLKGIARCDPPSGSRMSWGEGSMGMNARLGLVEPCCWVRERVGHLASLMNSRRAAQ